MFLSRSDPCGWSTTKGMRTRKCLYSYRCVMRYSVAVFFFYVVVFVYLRLAVRHAVSCNPAFAFFPPLWLTVFNNDNNRTYCNGAIIASVVY